MKYYLIDYENVHENGLEGLRSLSAFDEVIIFYGTTIKTIPFERCVELVKSNAKVDFIKVNKVGKNYLDFQLSTYLGYLICKGGPDSVVIVSKDTGFDSVVDFWKGRGIVICRQDTIGTSDKAQKTLVQAKAKTSSQLQATTSNASSLPEAYRKKIRTAVKGDNLSPSLYSVLYKAIEDSKSKVELNNLLVKKLGNSKAGVVYGHVKATYDEYLAAQSAQ